MHKRLLAGLAIAVGLGSPSVAMAQSTAWQGDATRAGAVSVPGLAPPLERAWSFPGQGGMPSAAVVVGDGVFFVAPTTTNAEGRSEGVDVVALDAATGTQRWRKSIPARYGDGGIAVVAGRLSVTTGDGRVASFGLDGSQVWSYVPAQEEIGVATPADFAGRTLSTSQSGDGDLITVDGGARSWAFTTGGSDAVPAVGDGVAYQALACGEVYAVHPDGSQRFRHRGTCSGPGYAASVADGRVYALSPTDQGHVVDASTGTYVRDLAASPALFPTVVGAGMAVYTTGLPNSESNAVQAERASDGTVAWRVPAPTGSQQFPPLLVNDALYLPLGQAVSVRDVRDGRVLQELPFGPTTGAGSQSPGLAAGAGLLLVPDGSSLTAWRSAGSAAATGPGQGTAAPAPAGAAQPGTNRPAPTRLGVRRSISRRELRRRGLRVTVRGVRGVKRVHLALRAGGRTLVRRAVRPRGRAAITTRLRPRRPVGRATTRLRLVLRFDGAGQVSRTVRIRRR